MYNKYKDRRPEDTIYDIITALHKSGIQTTYEFNPISIVNCWSNRVTMEGTCFGANGKGASKIYALASGYAELMERIQNNMFYTGGNNPKLHVERGFYYAPDERLIDADEYIAVENSFMRLLYQINQCGSYLEKRNLLLKGCNSYNEVNGIEKDIVLGIPFYNIAGKKTEYLPYQMYAPVYGSNGMSAGNTVEEALVQGLSEVYERYVNRYIIENKVVPPNVPDEVLEQTELYSIIEEIISSGRYRVMVKDLSLGKGYPVLGTIIVDTWNGSFGFRLGAHPSFQVALERTLTEALQGKTLQEFAASSKIDSYEKTVQSVNLESIFQTGEGCYGSSLFGDNASYEFTPFENISSRSNAYLVRKMTEPLISSGFDILVRNSGYLGFPALHIIVPGMSEIYKMDDEMFRFLNTRYKISKGMAETNGFGREERERIARFVSYSFLKSDYSRITMQKILSRPIENILVDAEYDIVLIMAVLFYSIGEDERALELFSYIDISENKRDNRSLTGGLERYIRLIHDGKSHEQAKRLVGLLYSSETSETVYHLLGDQEEAFNKLFADMKCWDCGHCKLGAERKCCYPQLYDMYNRLGKRMKLSMPSQEQMEDYF